MTYCFYNVLTTLLKSVPSESLSDVGKGFTDSVCRVDMALDSLKAEHTPAHFTPGGCAENAASRPASWPIHEPPFCTSKAINVQRMMSLFMSEGGELRR